ncbi:MAG TPA: hypothetical protein VHD56_19520 [Tepidisphaeraceae bacterium]|nr:hypothetical protein [Tepidisphaeraceae bacterium]
MRNEFFVPVLLMFLATSTLAQNSPAPQLPPFLKPGMRITYQGGNSTLRGTRMVLDPQFGYIKKGNDLYRLEEGRSGGGVGYTQLNIQAADPNLIAADVAIYLNVDLANNIVVGSGFATMVGNASGLGDYWKPLSMLSAVTDGPQPDGTVGSHSVYSLNGQNYNVVTIRYSGPNRTSINSYDLQTGLLISGGSIDTDAATIITDPNGVVQGSANGSAQISHLRFVSVRQVNIPWAGDPMPPGLVKGSRFEYQGGDRAVLGGGAGLPPLPPRAVAMSLIIGDIASGCAVSTIVQRADLGQGIPPSQTTANRCFSSAQLNGLWISPRAVAAMQPNQVLDQDPVTRFRVIFAGVQNGFASIYEQGPREMVERYYALQTGLLTSSRITRTTANIGQQITEYNLTGRQ